MRRLLLLLTLFCVAAVILRAERFVGTTPAGEAARKILGIAAAHVELLEWDLTLAAGRYELLCSYGNTAAGSPGLARDVRTVRHSGLWSREAGLTQLEVSGGRLALLAVSPDLLHVLNADGSLMVGDSGWSYTLNRASRTEPPVDMALTLSEQGAARRMLPLAAGPEVFAVLEGRTPCQGIARVLHIAATPGCMKVKWRITLFRDTTYRAESTLHRQQAQTGHWRLDGAVYRLAFGPGVEMVLRRGDDNVWFLLDGAGQPLVGTRYFSYTLNRRS